MLDRPSSFKWYEKSKLFENETPEIIPSMGVQQLLYVLQKQIGSDILFNFRQSKHFQFWY